MKRTDLLRYLRKHGRRSLREGANHTVYFNPNAGTVSTIPRHREINEFLARKICRDLEVASPAS